MTADASIISYGEFKIGNFEVWLNFSEVKYSNIAHCEGNMKDFIISPPPKSENKTYELCSNLIRNGDFELCSTSTISTSCKSCG